MAARNYARLEKKSRTKLEPRRTSNKTSGITKTLKTTTISHKSIIKLAAWAVLTIGIFVLLSGVTTEYNGLAHGSGRDKNGIYDPDIIGIVPLSIGPAIKTQVASGISRERCLIQSFKSGIVIPGSNLKGFPAMTKATPYRYECEDKLHFTYPSGYVINFLTAGLISLVAIYMVSLATRVKPKTSSKKQS